MKDDLLKDNYEGASNIDRFFFSFILTAAKKDGFVLERTDDEREVSYGFLNIL